MFDFLDDVPLISNPFGGSSSAADDSAPAYAGGPGDSIAADLSGLGGAGGAPSFGSYGFDPGDYISDLSGAGGVGGAGASGSGGQRGSDAGPPGPQQLSFVADDGGWDTTAWAVLTGKGLDRPRNISEMAESAEAQAANGPVSQVDLVGHGEAGVQSTGRARDPGGKITAAMSDADREAFRRMGATMTPDGEIVFGGCNVAAGDGTVMMAQAAAAAGHDVRAGTARQWAWMPGLEGPEVIVHPDGTSERRSNLLKDAYGWADEQLQDLGL